MNNNNNNNNKAFSLIELSIVLIIIGLLVAGITGGQSLIYSAKINGAMTEIQNFKQGIFAFKALKDRLPGDLKNNNQIGLNADQRYDDNTFGGDFVSSKCGLPMTRQGPQVELYLAKITNFKPQTPNCGGGVIEWPYGMLPSKNFKHLGFEVHFYIKTAIEYSNFDYGQHFIRMHRGVGKSTIPFYAKDGYNIDKKFDDGKPLSGKIIASNVNNEPTEDKYEKMKKLTAIAWQAGF